MEEMHEARLGERAQGSHTLSACTILLSPPYVHPPGSSPNPVLWFSWRLHYTGMMD